MTTRPHYKSNLGFTSYSFLADKQTLIKKTIVTDSLVSKSRISCYCPTMTADDHHHHSCKFLPKRIILVRHGESEGNIDTAAYVTTPDNKIQLTSLGLAQARVAGTRLHDLISNSSNSTTNWRVHFYVSPYQRTRSTLREIGRSFERERIVGVKEECRIREQDFGNFQIEERMKVIKETRERFGRFFYRFPEGESAADVFDRVSSTFFPLTWSFSWLILLMGIFFLLLFVS